VYDSPTANTTNLVKTNKQQQRKFDELVMDLANNGCEDEISNRTTNDAATVLPAPLEQHGRTTLPEPCETDASKIQLASTVIEARTSVPAHIRKAAGISIENVTNHRSMGTPNCLPVWHHWPRL
jgi:hypothetical protein